MAQPGRLFRIGVALGLSFCLPFGAVAGELRAPTIAASVAAAADWATTYHALKNFHLREANPLIRHLEHKPGRMISLGTVMDAGMVTTWNLTVGRRHEGAAVAGLWAMTAFRAYLAIHNLRNASRAERR